ncbi:hypothetical protein G6O69_18465 [Pseudenhygromyxa sp. WMMC2535]|uniref:hypothetical protein n=1 Tax=Pseudenhygromyxa sp. WMMC2535 TaxID=2712867 RepID=UPI001553532C|nr:hypothetical protein [Pseudenhygromyxa sp. WMMC2535]NVB39833.1 hypothetical protein [Pseudenhygromyxa sp. WMMC2535]
MTNNDATAWLDAIRRQGRDSRTELERSLRDEIVELKVKLDSFSDLASTRDCLRREVTQIREDCERLERELESVQKDELERARIETDARLRKLAAFAAMRRASLDDELLEELGRSFPTLANYDAMSLAQFEVNLSQLALRRDTLRGGFQERLSDAVDQTRSGEVAQRRCRELEGQLATRRAELEQLRHTLRLRHGVAEQVLDSLRNLSVRSAQVHRTRVLEAALAQFGRERDWALADDVFAGLER